jgi:hypothetical protein
MILVDTVHTNSRRAPATTTRRTHSSHTDCDVLILTRQGQCIATPTRREVGEEYLQHKENAALFLSFPYVCPEPVLLN